MKTNLTEADILSVIQKVDVSPIAHNTVFGFNVIESPFAVQRVWWRRPRSRKQRVRRKWQARPENNRDVPSAFILNGRLRAHPAYLAQLGIVRVCS